MRHLNSCVEIGRKRGLASARAWTPVAADADTLRRRALYDARGQVVREGVTYFGDGRETPWLVQRSMEGRSDQFDVLVSGKLWKTGGTRDINKCFSMYKKFVK